MGSHVYHPQRSGKDGNHPRHSYQTMARGPGQAKPGPTPPPSQEGARVESRTTKAKRTTLGNGKNTARAAAEATRNHRGAEKDSTDMAGLCGKGTTNPSVSHCPSSPRSKPYASGDRGSDRGDDSGKSTSPCSPNQYAHQGSCR